jgi:hypothetical protein
MAPVFSFCTKLTYRWRKRSERLLCSSNGVSGVDLVCQGHLAERLIVSRISKISELPSMRDYKPTVDIDLIKSFCCIRWIQNLILFVVH